MGIDSAWNFTSKMLTFFFGKIRPCCNPNNVKNRVNSLFLNFFFAKTNDLRGCSTSFRNLETMYIRTLYPSELYLLCTFVIIILNNFINKRSAIINVVFFSKCLKCAFYFQCRELIKKLICLNQI